MKGSSVVKELSNRKILLIPLSFHENQFLPDFKEKAELFNSVFPKRCSFIVNRCKFPTSLNYVTDKPLSIISFSPEDLVKIIWGLAPYKVHDHKNISILMLKIFGNTICKLSKKTFKQNLKNHRPVSQFSICSKIFFPIFLFVFSFLFLIKCLGFSLQQNLLYHTNLVLNKVTPASINCYQ